MMSEIRRFSLTPQLGKDLFFFSHSFEFYVCRAPGVAVSLICDICWKMFLVFTYRI